MAQVHLLIPSFNAGELSPLLGARFAVEKVQSGCRRLRNFLLHTHGPAFRRPGMEDMGPAKTNDSKSRLIGFTFSTTTSFVLEFNEEGLAVWSNGLLVPLVNEVALPYSAQECQELQFEQVNDVCYIVHPNHPPRQLTRHADDDWRLAEIDWDWPPMGDEHTRPDAVTTPTYTTALTTVTEEWPEFQIAATGTYTFTITAGDTTGVTKTVALQYWNGTAWILYGDTHWTTVSPAPNNLFFVNFTGTFRFTYTGPIKSGSSATLSKTGFSQSINLAISQPASQTPVTIAAGDWQTVVTCPATIPTGATLKIQRKSGATWVAYQTLTLSAGHTISTRMPKLLVATIFRFVWAGRAMAGSANIETLSFPAVTDVTLQVSDVAGSSRDMTASEPIFKAGHEGSYWQITHRRDNSTAEIIPATTIAAASTAAILVTGKWDLFTYGTWTTTIFLERQTGATWEIVRSWKGKADRNIIASGDEAQPANLRLRVIAGTSTAGARFVLECADASFDGLVRITALGALDGDGRTDTATVDVISGLYATTATAIWTEGAFSTARGFPRAVAIHQGRLWFGGVIAEPTRLWGSVSNDYLNFRRSSFDDGSISVTPASQRSNVVQWLTSLESTLVIGTKGDEWTLSATSDVIKPTDLQMLRRSSYGSAYSQAVQVGDALVFVQRGGQRLRQVAPRSDAQQWSAADLTVLAEHVGTAGFTSFAVMSAPMVILWCVSGDGKLLGMTFEREQNVFGWHVHETDGLVESVAVISGALADEVWLLVNRAGVRRIERLDATVLARDFSAPERLVYLDSARRFEFESPSASLTGLDHLNGKTVSLLLDGVEATPVVVSGGVVTLGSVVSTAVVGLPFTSELQPMRMDIPLRDGTAQNRKWRTSRVGMYLHASRGGEVADSPEKRFEKIPLPGSELFTGDAEVVIESDTRDGVDVIIRQTGAKPLNIGSITIKGDVFGE